MNEPRDPRTYEVGDLALLSLEQIDWCLTEVTRQCPGGWYAKDLQVQYNRMFFALCNTIRNTVRSEHLWDNLYEERIKAINAIINPDAIGEYRTSVVSFTQGTTEASDPIDVPEHMHRLFRNMFDPEMTMTAAEFTKEFLVIHPFADGNGRTAAIIYNLIKGTLANPEPLPDFFGVH